MYSSLTYRLPGMSRCTQAERFRRLNQGEIDSSFMHMIHKQPETLVQSWNRNSYWTNISGHHSALLGGEAHELHQNHTISMHIRPELLYCFALKQMALARMQSTQCFYIPCLSHTIFAGVLSSEPDYWNSRKIETESVQKSCDTFLPNHVWLHSEN